MKFLTMMCVYILFMFYFDFGLCFLEIKVLVYAIVQIQIIMEIDH